LVECIIDKDDNKNYTKQMRIDLKNEVKQMQEEWKQLDEEELTKKCTEELAKFEPMENNLNSFGCSAK
jgi:tRNA uridine 5-carbamoylmethylation protein Kti12